MVIAALHLNILFLKGEELSLPDLNVDYKLKIAEIKVKFFDKPIINLKYRRVSNKKWNFEKFQENSMKIHMFISFFFSPEFVRTYIKRKNGTHSFLTRV